VAGRALAFSDKEIARLATEEYVPVAGDDWYQRRREDAEGEFYKKVSDQGPRRNTDGSTRQGIYLFTASGKLLAYKNAQDADVMREVLQRGLAEWKKLPAAERRPGAVKVEELTKTDARYTRKPPEGGLILATYTRILEDDDKGELCKGTCRFTGGDAAARDHVWLTKADWESLIPRSLEKGRTDKMPERVAAKLVRYHLIDNTRGEPEFWRPQEVRKLDVSMTTEELTDQTMRLRIEGAALLSTDLDTKRAKRGYDVALRGTLVYDVEKKAVTRFDLVAVGEHWGEGRYTPGARPGRKPLGVAFELAGDRPADRVPPQAARDYEEYMGK
jgi:hypothetical protein